MFTGRARASWLNRKTRELLLCFLTFANLSGTPPSRKEGKMKTRWRLETWNFFKTFQRMSIVVPVAWFDFVNLALLPRDSGSGSKLLYLKVFLRDGHQKRRKTCSYGAKFFEIPETICVTEAVEVGVKELRPTPLRRRVILIVLDACRRSGNEQTNTGFAGCEHMFWREVAWKGVLIYDMMFAPYFKSWFDCSRAEILLRQAQGEYIEIDGAMKVLLKCRWYAVHHRIGMWALCRFCSILQHLRFGDRCKTHLL